MSGVVLVQEDDRYNLQSCVMANSSSFDLNDPVVINSSGFLAPAAATEKIQGWFAQADVTSAADNQTVGLVRGAYIPADVGVVFELTADQACTQTDVGAYADFAVSGGVYTANLAAGASGQMEIIDFDPNDDGTTTLVRAVLAERQQDAYAQA